MSDGSVSRGTKSGVGRPVRTNVRARLVLRLVCLLILFSGVVYGQANSNQLGAAGDVVGQDKLSEAVSEVKGGNWASVDEIVSEAGPARALPILHDLFTNSRDTEVKERIAGALVKLGDKDGAYFDFMLARGTEAVDNYVPYPFPLQPDKNQPQVDRQDPDALRKQVTPEFMEWAKSRGVPLNVAAQEALQTIPGRLLLLGLTGNKRAIPVLRRGLSSPNIMIEAMAAAGLAQLKDKDSIPLIIAACERTPVAAPAIAMGLMSFDDPRAQSAAKSYLARLQEAARAQSAGQNTNLNVDQPK